MESQGKREWGNPWEVAEELLKEIGEGRTGKGAAGQAAPGLVSEPAEEHQGEVRAIGYGRLFLEGPPAAVPVLPSTEA